MLHVYKSAFKEVIIVEYEKVDMIAKMLCALGMEPTFNSKAYRRNKRSLRYGRTVHRVSRAIFGTEEHGPKKVLTKVREKFLRDRV